MAAASRAPPHRRRSAPLAALADTQPHLCPAPDAHSRFCHTCVACSAPDAAVALDSIPRACPCCASPCKQSQTVIYTACEDEAGAPAQMVTFEAFRDLVKLLQLGVGDEAGIALAEEENVEARAAAQSAAAAEAASGAPVGPPMPFSAPSGAESKARQTANISNPTAARRPALWHRGRPVRAVVQPGGLLAAHSRARCCFCAKWSACFALALHWQSRRAGGRHRPLRRGGLLVWRRRRRGRQRQRRQRRVRLRRQRLRVGWRRRRRRRRRRRGWPGRQPRHRRLQRAAAARRARGGGDRAGAETAQKVCLCRAPAQPALPPAGLPRAAAPPRAARPALGASRCAGPQGAGGVQGRWGAGQRFAACLTVTQKEQVAGRQAERCPATAGEAGEAVVA